MKNVIFTSPIPQYSWVLILVCACICCVINEKSKFYTKNGQKTERKKKHLRLNIPFSGFSYGNSLYIAFASRRTYCNMVSALNSLYNAMKIF